jgi:hypothetical protein
MKRLFILSISSLLGCMALAFPGDPDSWWPEQKAPRQIVTCTIKRNNDMREQNLAQSVSGLAAQALNEGRTEEGVWIATPNPDYAIYFSSLLKRLDAKNAGAYDVWSLVNRYVKKGIIKGYILYDHKSQDNALNLATVYAGIKKGILIDVTQEKIARSKGLEKLYDATGKVFDEKAFMELQGELNPRLVVVANPKFFNNRDYAIAHKSMVYYGIDSLFMQVLQWVKPLSLVIGWNKGDEFKHIEPCTRYGLINTATDWCVNLPLLTVAGNKEPGKVRSLDPKKINWQEKENYHAFVMSDGDNMQWTFGGFLNNKAYWANSNNASIPMSFTTCVLNLALAGADVYRYLLQSQPAQTSVVEYGGGYYYPDLFAKARPDGEKILRQYAAMINVQMKRTGTKVFGFICRNIASEEAIKAYRIYAQEIEDLTGMIAVQYSPYNGGLGKTIWVKNKKGVEIPVVAARYQLWANLRKPGSGDPQELAGFINNDNKNTTADNRQLNWTIVHAWSSFSQPGDSSKTDSRGVTPVAHTKALIEKGTRVVSIEELLWRIRMQHDAAATRNVIGVK